MEIEVRVIATTEVAVDVRVTPIDGRFPGPPDAPRYRFVFSDDLVLRAHRQQEAGGRPSGVLAGSACRHAFGIRHHPSGGRRER